MKQTSKKKKKVPWIFRRKLSCPNCGFIIQIDDIKYEDNFTCPRCKAYYSGYDFWEENSFKWDYSHADLSYEISD